MKFWKITAVATVLMTSMSANAALIERLDGLAYYDDVADLTWLADANAGIGSSYDTADGIADGRMTWQAANDWAAGLTVGGVSGWRLANTVDVGNDGMTYRNIYEGVDHGFNITTPSELSNMFYNVLGNTASYDTSGTLAGCKWPNYCLTNTGPFSNLKPFYYWSATEYAPKPSYAWLFNMSSGAQVNFYKPNMSYSWAVQSGDVSAVVPVPAAVWLFGSGLIGLVGLARRKR